MQEKGYVSKSKSLEDVLKSTEKRDAKLIGYDETPIDVISPEAIEPEMVEEQPPFYSSRHGTSSKPLGSSTNRIKQAKVLHRYERGQSSESNSSDNGSETSGTIKSFSFHVG